MGATKFDAADLVDRTSDYIVSQQEVLKPASFKVVLAGQLRLLTHQPPTCNPITMDDATGDRRTCARQPVSR